MGLTMTAAEVSAIARHQAMRIGRLREALAIVSAHPGADGTYTRDRAVCRELAERALERDEREAREFFEQPTPGYALDEECVEDAVAAVRADLERARDWVSKSIMSEVE